MNDAIRIEQLNTLRHEFKAYLRDTNPNWNESWVSTIVSDAFFALNNNVGVDFWAGLTSEESLLVIRDHIRDYLRDTTSPDRVEERANGYLSALRRLKAFLDDKHPTLAAEWSGKSISGANLQAEFIRWMQKEKKSNGESYSPNTINAYANALKNATAKLNLGNAVHSNLFYYTSAAEFAAARRSILSAPNFEQVDAAAGNGAYSSGMSLYARFLAEMGESSAWIFQGNPKYYDVVGAVETLDVVTWSVNQYRRQIKAGDKAYIWVSGSGGGIVASGTVMGDPEMREPDLHDPYAKGTPLKTEPHFAVDIRLERKFTENIVRREVLLADDRTKRLDILTFPSATNFRVTKAQEEVIESIIAGNYKRVPVVDAPKSEVVSKRRYWLYAPGEQARYWDEFFKAGIMAIGWDEVGDLSEYEARSDIVNVLKKKYGQEGSYKNDSLALWQFANDISVGDVVFVKRGLYAIIGRGIVTSGYSFDPGRDEYRHVRKVDWTHKGEWEHPGQAVLKTLTDITPYTDYVEKLQTLILGEGAAFGADDEPEITYPDYSESDFLDEVFMDPKRYTVLKGLLRRKKNVILQGAPGVGKTFAAQRLAFSVMGEKDTSRVKIVQFHQSYSYEDFVMGYRPDGNGFKLVEGPFYRFCKTAADDDERPYFFIIDEINRGNVSKIFGELLMLIESDKRGEEHALRLLYKDEQFFVPENVYIIGMMNTADRSLAMIDYALRRRFAFFDMEPAFDSEGFKARQRAIQNLKFDALIQEVRRLNDTIAADPSLGAGFRIGHSYFCTNDVVDDAWLASVIDYELIPLLEEYWFDEPEKLEIWTTRLRSAIRDQQRD